MVLEIKSVKLIFDDFGSEIGTLNSDLLVVSSNCDMWVLKACSRNDSVRLVSWFAGLLTSFSDCWNNESSMLFSWFKLLTSSSFSESLIA